ncbi:SPOSA6832_04907 [Sporobolomyces salmonicolor]|uniref:SPOSA6832_04907-mRNA-1:cds n=1 Tax=Sporidiobolus salmonicolor TaxID=5005 RepID=A0A0D6ESS7_SPOSA|nr:SPOSA6832_04907 [Sporobolomyces salmonicolor]
MANKRDLDDSDASNQSVSSSAKRQRIAIGSLLSRSSPPLPSQGDGDVEYDPDRAHDDEEDMDEDEEGEEEEEEDRRQVQRLVATQKAKPTKIAEAGVIKRVRLENFMCHYATEVKFGPQVNFLVGVNGSGKSAILTGITMALGGNAKATNRGQKGGDLIMEGRPLKHRPPPPFIRPAHSAFPCRASSARCCVTLANKGEDSFKPEMYGTEITIERTMNKSGGGNYKIKNSEGKTVDTKKATLDLILDHFNIQVDNPMTVLTQDQSRQFLASASPKDKYTLAQLTEEYEQIRANVEMMEEALQRKKEVLPELKEAYRRAKERAKEVEAAVEQQGNLQTLKDQFVWSYVDDIEQVKPSLPHFLSLQSPTISPLPPANSFRRELNPEGDSERSCAGRGSREAAGVWFDRVVSRLISVRRSHGVLQARKTDIESEIAVALEAEAESKKTIDDRRPQLEELKQKIDVQKAKLMKWKHLLTRLVSPSHRQDAERALNATVLRLRAQLGDIEQQLHAEQIRINRDLDAERQPLLANIEKANGDIAQLGIQLNNDRLAADNLTDNYRRHAYEYEAATSNISGAQQQYRDVDTQIRHLHATAGNRLMAYGSAMPRLLQAIDSERGWREKPIGPIGLHVKLNQKEYGSALESFFSQSLNAFIVTNEDDRKRLRAIWSQNRIDFNIPIIMNRYDPNFDFSKGQPDPQILTVLRACTIDHPLVLQTLVTNQRIERAALVPRRPDGDILMRREPYNVDAAYSADMFQLRIHNGKSSTQSMADWKGGSRLSEDMTAQLAKLDEDKQHIAADIQKFEQQKLAAGQQAAQSQREKHRLDLAIKDAQKKIQQLNSDVAQWNDKLNEEETSNIGALQANKEEIENEIESATAQYEAGLQARSSEDGNMAPIVDQRNAIDQEVKKAEQLVAKIAGHLQKQYSEMNTIDRQIARTEADKVAHLTRLAKYQGEVEEFRTTLEERMEQASAVCPRPQVEKTKDAKRLQKEIESIEKALKERERRQGASIEQILEELEVRKKVAREAVKQTNEIASLIRVRFSPSYFTRKIRSSLALPSWQALDDAYQARTSRWNDFRSHISVRARLQFIHHLSNRGFHGKLKFDHEHQQLHISVQTDDVEKGSQAKKRKDAKSLSGGEKSFSTICLLLTMWEAVGCPLRCLDEFDAVNRRISMKMMIETAKTANSTQFILITPQDMGSISWGSEVKVSKLDDPKRAAGALARGM